MINLLQEKSYFFIRTNQKIERVLLEDILYIEGLTNYITIHTKQKKFVAYLTLKAMEKNAFSEIFVRIHKSYLVPVSKIVAITANEVQLETISLPISRTFKSEMMKKITALMPTRR